MNALNSRTSSAVIVVTAFFGFLITTEQTALAQRTPSSIQRRVDQLNRQGEQFERDNLGREITGDGTDRRRSQALMAEVKRDLEALQAGYNQIVMAMAAKKTVDDAGILEAVVEIKECSTRLKHHLALPDPKDDKTKVSAAVMPSEAPLITLRKHIYSFVMNPLFETPAVIDVEQAKNASRDLDRIIELSESISKHHTKKKSSN